VSIILLPIVPTTQHQENIWVIADKNVTVTVTLIVVVVIQAETVTATIVVVVTVIGIGTRMVVTAVVTGATVIVVAHLHAGVTRRITVGAAAGVIHAVLTGVAALPEVVEAVAILILPQHQPLHQAIDGKKNLGRLRQGREDEMNSVSRGLDLRKSWFNFFCKDFSISTP
jgi:hypothetical protein